MEPASRTGPVHHRTAAVGGVNVFYREAGPGSGPVVLLLHGFPSSSRMFRDLIPRLSDACHLIAPDYPAFGHSAVPDRSAFGYTFDHLADVVDGLLGQLGIGTFATYVMDFGAAAGFRLALRHPERLSAIIVQNAPLYPWEPRGWWATLGQYWADGSAAHRYAARSYLDLDGLRGQYLSGVQDPTLIDPDNWVIDKALIDRPGVDEIMLDLLYDIPNQVPVFTAMQEFLRDRRPPLLVATGANGEIFPETGCPADPHRPPGRRVPRAPERPLRAGGQGSRDRRADAGLPGTDRATRITARAARPVPVPAGQEEFMTITVIGATGNVGTLVARRLLAEGQRVRALVRDPDKARDRLGPDSRLEIITGDLGTPADLEAAFRGAAFSWKCPHFQENAA